MSPRQQPSKMRPQELVRIREALGLSQRELAAELGFSQAHMSRLESGHRSITKRLELQLRRMETANPTRREG